MRGPASERRPPTSQTLQSSAGPMTRGGFGSLGDPNLPFVVLRDQWKSSSGRQTTHGDHSLVWEPMTGRLKTASTPGPSRKRRQAPPLRPGEDCGVAVEIDGFRWHGNRPRFHSDRRRITRLAAAGIQVTPISWSQIVDEPTATAVQSRRRRHQPPRPAGFHLGFARLVSDGEGQNHHASLGPGRC
jgi:hypothetical protein